MNHIITILILINNIINFNYIIITYQAIKIRGNKKKEIQFIIIATINIILHWCILHLYNDMQIICIGVLFNYIASVLSISFFFKKKIKRIAFIVNYTYYYNYIIIHIITTILVVFFIYDYIFIFKMHILIKMSLTIFFSIIIINVISDHIYDPIFTIDPD